MFGIGLFEIIVVVVAALLFVGPSKLPELARQFGRVFVQVRRMTADVRSTVDQAIRQAEHDILLEEKQKLRDLLESKAASDSVPEEVVPSEGHAEGAISSGDISEQSESVPTNPRPSFEDNKDN